MDVFSALAEPTRRSIIEMLASHGHLSASEISDRFPVSASAISQHLKILREAELVHMEKQAQQRIYRINPDTVHELEQWARDVREMWDERFDALDLVLEAEQKAIDDRDAASISQEDNDG